MKKITTLSLGLLLASAAFAQKGNKAEVLPSLQSTLGKHFLIGVAVDTRLPAGQDPAAEAIVKEQFNQVVAENCMKGEVNHPEVNRFDFTDGDKLVDWAQKNGKTVIGHCWYGTLSHLSGCLPMPMANQSAVRCSLVECTTM